MTYKIDLISKINQIQSKFQQNILCEKLLILIYELINDNSKFIKLGYWLFGNLYNDLKEESLFELSEKANEFQDKIINFTIERLKNICFKPIDTNSENNTNNINIKNDLDDLNKQQKKSDLLLNDNLAMTIYAMSNVCSKSHLLNSEDRVRIS